MPTLPGSTNWVRNPSFEYGTTNWTTTNCTLATANSSVAWAGSQVGLVTITSIGAEPNVRLTTAGRSTVAAGDKLRVQFKFRPLTNSIGQRVAAQLLYFNSGGTQISFTTSSDLTLAQDTWGVINMTDTAPALAVSVELRMLFRITGAAPLFAVNDAVYIDALDLRRNDVLDYYFDGDSEFAHWAGTAGDSQSIRDSQFIPSTADSTADGAVVSWMIYRADRHNQRYGEITDYVQGGTVTFDHKEDICGSFSYQIKEPFIIDPLQDWLAVFMYLDWADGRPGTNKQVGLFSSNMPSGEHIKALSTFNFTGHDVTSLLASSSFRHSYTIYSSGTNYALNPSFEYGTLGWTTSQSSLTNALNGGWSGSRSGTVTITSVGATHPYIATSPATPVVAGDIVRARAELRPVGSAPEGKRVEMAVRFLTSGSVFIKEYVSDTVSLTTGWGNRIEKKAKAPSNAAFAEVRLRFLTTATPGANDFDVGHQVDVDAVQIRLNERIDTYFDGDMDGVAWLGQPGNSYSYASPKNWITEATRIATDAGFLSRKVRLVPTSKTMSTSRTWDPGTTRLEAINDLLHAIGWYPVMASSDGDLVSEPIKRLSQTEPFAEYWDYHLLAPVQEAEPDDTIFNVVIVTRESGTKGIVSRSSTNDREESPVSTVRLGYEKVRTITDADVDDSDAAKAVADKALDEATSFERILDIVVPPNAEVGPNRTIDLHFWTDAGYGLSGRYWVKQWSFGLTPSEVPLKLTVGRMTQFPDQETIE